MQQKEGRKFSFGEFEVDTEKRLLLNCGQAVRLKSKTFDLLLTLIEHRGEILSKTDLLGLVWANQYVEENNLTVHIAALRKALGEAKDEHRFIVTMPGQGYKFVADLLKPSEKLKSPENDEIIIESQKIERIIIEEEEA